MGGPAARCTGPAVEVGFAYQGEPDGSSPAVGDVYQVVFQVQNLGNCVSMFANSTTYYASVRFSPPKRHKAIHNFSYGNQQYAIQCTLVDPSGTQRNLAATDCAENIIWSVLDKQWQINVPGVGKWSVPAGHTLNVFMPVLAIDAVAANEAVFSATVSLELDSLGAGSDSVDFQQPILTAASPLQVTDAVAKDITPTGALLSANIWTRFTGADVYFQIDPGPLFDGRRFFATSPDLHNGPFQTLWANLQPDTEYQWQALMVINNQVVGGEMQSFRTPPLTGGRWVTGDQAAAQSPNQASVEEIGRLSAGCHVATGGPPQGPFSLLLVAALGLCGLILHSSARQRCSKNIRALFTSGLGLLLVLTLTGSGCGGGDAPATPPGGGGDGTGGMPDPNTGANPSDPGRDPATDNGQTMPDPNMGGQNRPPPPFDGPLRLTFLRAGPGQFTVPEGWEVNQKSLEAWRRDAHHVITLSPPGNPGIVAGVRTFLTTATPEHVMTIASSQASDMKPFEADKGESEGLFARFAATATVGGRPVVMGMYSWSTLANPKGERAVFLAAVVTPDRNTFDRFGGTNTLRKMAYGQTVTSENEPEFTIEGTFIGDETEGLISDPFNILIFKIEFTVMGNRISAMHSIYSRLGLALEKTWITKASGTVIQSRGMLVPTWESCNWSSLDSAGAPGSGACPTEAWGATLHVIPKQDGKFLVRMPGMENGTLDAPGTLTVIKQ